MYSKISVRDQVRAKQSYLSLEMALPLLLLLLLYTATSISAMPSTLEHIDPTLPPVLVPGQTPKCSVIALQQDFADTVGAPPASANYTQPPECPFPWTRVVLELSVSASDLQKDRIAAVWIDGAEVLRTTTPIPKAPGSFWKVEKDITRYAALLRQLGQSGPNGTGGVISMMLENSNKALPGVYSANVSLHFYRGMAAQATSLGVTAHPTIRGLYQEPADLIIPVSNENGYFGSGFWFKVENDTHVVSSAVRIPTNSYRAVLEIFVSYHGDDENWYMNPLRASYLNHANNLSAPRTNGGFRQLYATIDGEFIGGHIPFAVIYPGAINPFFWSPVASIGAFDMPTYDLDVTPFMSMLLDGQMHEFGFGVRDAQAYWLVSANLHVWVDMWSDSCQAGLVQYNAPPLKINRNAEWGSVDGQSEINAERLSLFSGWVSSSRGNLTTIVRQKLKFKSQVEVQNRGAVKQVEVNNKGRTEVEVVKSHQTIGRVQVLMEGPLQVMSSSVSAVGGASFQKTRLFHQLEEIVNLNEGQATRASTLTDRQDAEGSALMHEGQPVWGSGRTRSQYRYRDASACYLRSINTAGGLVVMDTKSATCATVADA